MSSEQCKTRVDQITLAICHDEARSAGITTSENFVELMQQVTSKQLEYIAEDLDAFSKHAKRTTIRPEDVLLCARKNPQMVESLKQMIPEKKTRKKKNSS
mmetsp:Transcript_2702/g.3320  ORF Transcript_2702/g.3320 Transcript_2702/m.3320 type:complete len:100 (-) Transcript_2702:114-413(-)